MKGILKLAYKLLVNDWTKFTALLVGISFAVLLMTQMTSMFAGVLYRAPTQLRVICRWPQGYFWKDTLHSDITSGCDVGHCWLWKVGLKEAKGS